MKYALVGSSGGHLTQLLALRSIWERGERIWVTFDKPDARSHLAGEHVVWAAFPTNRHIPNLLRNTLLAVRVLRRERPAFIISTGAGVAIPFFVLGRLFGCTLVYLEVFDRIETPTITGRICHGFSHIFALQWDEQKAHYRRGTVIGPVL